MGGPCDLEIWRACYHVFKAAAVMLRIAHPAVLERYEALFEQRCKRFPGAWHIHVLADMRCRCEFFGADRRRLRGMRYKCPSLSDFDTEMPWNAVIRSASEDLVYWHRNVDSPALEFTLSRGNKEAPRNSEYRAGVASSSGTHTGQQVQKQQQKPELPANWKATNIKRG